MVASATRKKEWQKLVTQWRAGGLSQRAFALEHGVTQREISYWSRSLTATAPLPGFVPLRVMSTAAAVAISLRSERGWTLTLPHDVPAAFSMHRTAAFTMKGCTTVRTESCLTSILPASNKLSCRMPAKPLPNRRTNERRVDNITMKARTMVGTLKRTIGTSAARRFLEKNGYGADLVHDMMTSSVERRCSRRRADGYTVRTKPQRANPQPMRKADISGPLGAEELKALYQLRSANDSENVFIRVCDCPPQFVRFGFMEPGPRGARITERGRATLLHWTRAKGIACRLAWAGNCCV